MYAYIKAQPKKDVKKLPRKWVNILSATFIMCGILMIGTVVYPIIGWYALTLPAYQSMIVSPLSAVVAAGEAISPSRSDSYKMETWFSGAKTFSEVSDSLKTYTISVPKLKIEGAVVEVGGSDLKKSLLAWPTSALPGVYGNNIIFGHSELPQFASPKDYSGIFTHLMDLTKGDEVFIDYDGIRFKYEMVDKKIIAPTDLSVLEQRFDAGYVTLITCEPPGTTWMRGVVRARLVQI